VTAASGSPGVVAAWCWAARPRTLGASLVPVLVGSAVADAQGELRPLVGLGCAAAALLLQIAANWANDAQDFLGGVDTAARRGAPRASQSGWLSPHALLRGAALAVAVAAAIGAWLVSLGGAPILALGLLACAAALGYSGGPFPLATRGLGEVAAFVFFGVVAVVGTSYLQSGRVSSLALLASLPVGALVTGIMVVNNLRDRETDAAAGRRTLAVRWGERATRGLFAALLVAAFAAPPLLWLGALAGPAVLASLLAAPLARGAWRGLRAARAGAAFDAVLVGVARLHLVFGVLFAAGIAV
jgi:1,4-dihydroxy-2-naphthoate octaprenyltransferase